MVYDGAPADADAARRSCCRCAIGDRLDRRRWRDPSVSISRMQEFDSVSVVLVRPRLLATKLTEKSADGWDGGRHRPAGSDVDAVPQAVRRRPPTTPTAPRPAPTPADRRGRHRRAVADSTTEPAAAPRSPPTRRARSSRGRPSRAPAGASLVEPVDRRGGQRPDRRVEPARHSARLVDAPVDRLVVERLVAAAPAAQPAATPQVPAGWYADPAGRFELRYWDGSTWTEHVSRAGQQFTDPPVA